MADTIKTRKELAVIVCGIAAHTLIAHRMYDALGIPRPTVTARYGKHGHAGKRGKRRGAEKPMRQRHGARP